MKLRSIIFWPHLISGISAGLVILMMSVTGVLLTYERQITAWFDRDYYNESVQGVSRLPLTDLMATTRDYGPEFNPSILTVSSDPSAPVTVPLNRGRNLYLNPYTGAVLGEGAQGIRKFFHAVTGWHRWFNTEGESRATARAVIGACNLLFLFLLISGIYLWLPRRFKWPFVRGVLFFNPRVSTPRARDFNWHHVFGIWSSLPLIVVIATAVVFSYSWANKLVFLSVGEEPPQRSMHGPGPGPQAGNRDVRTKITKQETTLGLDELFERAARQLDDWKTISIYVPRSTDSPVISFTIDQGNGGQPQKRHQLTLSRETGEVVNWEPFDTQSAGSRLRVLIRFLHTGEVLGVPGQTVAGLVSLTSVIMVWTGLALAYRRLIQPLIRKPG